MRAVGYSYRRNHKPGAAVQLDTGNSLLRGLVFCALPIGGNFYEIFSKQWANHAGTLRARKTVNGNRSASVSAVGQSTTGGAFANITGLDKVAGAVSIFCEGSLEVDNSTGTVILSNETNNNHGCGLRFDDTAIVTNSLIYYAEGGNRSNTASDSLGANSHLSTYRVSFAHDGTNIMWYINGKLVQTTAVATVPVADPTRRTQILGHTTAGVENGASCALVLAWNRAITAAEAKKLHDNPWQIFSRQARRLHVTAAAPAVTASVKSVIWMG